MAESDVDPARIVDKFFSALQVDRFDDAAKVVTDDVTIHLGDGRNLKGHGALRDAISAIERASGPGKLHVDRITTVGGFVVAGWSIRQSRLLLRAPLLPGRASATAAVFRAEGGRIAEVWGLVPPKRDVEVEFEGDDDDDFVGGRPPGPKKPPPIPSPRDDDGAL